MNMNTETNDKELKIIFKNQQKDRTRSKLRITEDNMHIFKKYESTARTLVRGAWFFDYIGHLFEWYASD